MPPSSRVLTLTWIRTDEHPVVSLAGAADLVDLLRQKGYSTPGDISRWLADAFPLAIRSAEGPE